MVRALPLALALIALPVVVGGSCNGKYVDDDNKSSDARQVIPDMQVVDSLDFGKGDKEDFKNVTPLYDGTVKLAVTVGDPFNTPHGLTGEIGVYTARRDLLDKKTVEPSVAKYELTFKGEAHVSYVFRFRAVSGKSSYTIDYSQELEPVDPCENVECEENQECQEGQCVEVDDDEPEDKAGCPGGCPRGHYCNKAKRKCIKRACYGVRCKSNEYCSKGKCRRKSRPKPTLKCKSGFVVKGGKCVKKGGSSTPGPGPVSSGGGKTGPIAASVIQIQPSGAKTRVLLGRGKAHNVKVGDTGRVGGHSFRVTKVFASRCWAKVNAPHSKLSGVRRATIVRK